MKLLLIFPNWLGRSGNYCHSAALKLGYESYLVWGSNHEVMTIKGYLQDKARRAPLIAANFIKYESNLINQNISQKAKNIRPDIVINNCPTLFPETIEILKKNSHCLIFWAGDDPALFPRLISTLHLYDFFFTGASNWLQGEIATIRKENNYYLPYGCDTEVFNKCALSEIEKKKYGSTVSFVGARYSDRENFLAQLTDYDLAIWGWKKDHLIRKIYRTIRGKRNNPFHIKYHTDEELYLPALNQRIRGAFISNNTANKIYNASSVILNLQHPQMLHAVNSKTFEIAASGGFQILQHTGDLTGLFEKDKEIVCFSEKQELREKIQFYLDNPYKRDEISTRARNKVLKEHTFKHRLKFILAIVGRS